MNAENTIDKPSRRKKIFEKIESFPSSEVFGIMQFARLQIITIPNKSTGETIILFPKIAGSRTGASKIIPANMANPPRQRFLGP
jgi:hypothetical protein